MSVRAPGFQWAAALRRRRPELAALAGMCAIYFFSYFQRVGVPGTIFDELQVDFQASAGAITVLSVIFLYVYGGMQIVAGVLTDRAGTWRMLTAGGLLLSFGSLLFPLAASIPQLYGARVLIALGASLIYAGLVKGVATLFHAYHYPILLGLALGAGYAGGLAGTLPLERAVEHWGWRPALLGTGVLCLLSVLAAAVLIARVRSLRAVHRHSPGLPGIGRVLRNPRNRPVMITGALNFSVYFLFQATLGKKLLLDYYRIPSATAAAYTFVMMLVTIGCVLVSGAVSRALGNRRKPVMQCAVLCMLAGALLLCANLLFGLSHRWVLVSYCLLGMTSLSSPLGNALMKEHNPAEMVATAIGLANAGCYLAVAAVTGIAGWVLDLFAASAVVTPTAVRYPREAYLTVAALCVVALAASFASSCALQDAGGGTDFPLQ